VSIGAIVDRFGKRLWLYRPTIARLADGRIERTYAKVVAAKFFVQPQGQTQEVAEGRINSRTASTLYAAGVIDIRVDDELRENEDGTGRVFRVTGTINPGEMGVGEYLSMTVCEAVEVEPDL